MTTPSIDLETVNVQIQLARDQLKGARRLLESGKSIDIAGPRLSVVEDILAFVSQRLCMEMDMEAGLELTIGGD